jgi:uracil-DNA glycosylase
VEAALATCTSRYLRRILEVSGARVIVLVGRISARAFESEVDVRLEEGFWGPGELLGGPRCVVSLPHPNAIGPRKGLAPNLGPDRAERVREFAQQGATTTSRLTIDKHLL